MSSTYASRPAASKPKASGSNVRRLPTDRLGVEPRHLRLVSDLKRFPGRAIEVVYRFRSHPTVGFDYVSPSVVDLIGWSPGELYENADILFDAAFPEDRDRVGLMLRGGFPIDETNRLRWRHRDGSVVWTEQWVTPVMEDGRLVAVDGTARDITAQVLAEATLRDSDERFRAMLHHVDLCAVAIDVDGRITFANPFLARLVGREPVELEGLDWFEAFIPEDERAGQRQAWTTFAKDGTTTHIEAGLQTPAGGLRVMSWSPAPIYDGAGTLTGIVALGDDVTASRQARAIEQRLKAAVEQTAESVVIADRNGNITYVNPAFERVTGYSLDEVIGGNPRLIQSGRQDEAFYAEMWASLTAGETWSGELVNRRKDGRLFVEEGTITPIRDAGGEITDFVAVKRDVTYERAMAASLEAARAERLAVARMISEFEPGPTPQATAAAIVAALADLPDIDAAWIVTFEPDGTAIVFAASPAPFPASFIGTIVPDSVVHNLQRLSAAGPWLEAWSNKHVGLDFLAAAAAAGITATASAPIGNGSGAVALLRIATAHPDGVARLSATTATLAEVAAAARPLLEPALRTRWESERTRARIADVLEGARFGPVFQPVVQLADRAVVGFEALTRFADGTAPDHVFADAASAGLGLKLEIAALTASLAAAEALPAGTWLSLNVSPRTLLNDGYVARVLEARSRPIVLELTEHERVDDYAALREAIVALGPDIRTAVDDAGAGIANFSHLVELRPDFVKIDIGLVRGVNADLTRQALVVGLRHFAQAMDRDVIAEGVETEAERRTLLALGVRYGQGYLFGRPDAAAAWVAEEPATA